MKIREIILTFVVLLHQNLRSEAFDGPDINFTKLEEAKSIKPNQFDEFKNQERILITDIINKIGNPVSLGDISKFGMCFIYKACLLYTSPSPRDQRGSRMPSSA